MNEAVMNAVFELLEQNQKLTTMVACDAAKKDELMNIVYAMLKTEHRIQPKEVELYDHRAKTGSSNSNENCEKPENPDKKGD